MGTLVLDLFLFCGISSAFTAEAVTVGGVTVSEGSDYTNVTVSVTATGVSGETLVYAVKDQTDAVLASAEAAAVEGANSLVLDLSALASSVRNKTHCYEVSVKGASPAVAASAYYSNVGWRTNLFFRADATSGTGVYENGAWSGTAPAISDGAFAISCSDATFALTDSARGEGHDIVDFRCNVTIDSCFSLDDLTNAVTGAIGAISLVTNEEKSVAAKWMILVDGTNWSEATGAAAVTNDYCIRAEIDYGASPVRIRYSLKKTDDADWSVLSVAGSEWTQATNQAASVSDVSFVGQASVAKFGAKLSTKAVAEAGGTEYADILGAMAAAKADGKAFVLFTNAKVDPAALVAGTYGFKANGKTFTVADRAWKVADGSGKTVTVGDGTITVVAAPFVAKIGSDDATAAVYTSLGAALAAGADETVVVLTNVAENATSTVANVTLDLNGFSLAEKASDAAILTVDGENATLLLTGGGAITGATAAAICATNGATVALDGLFVTNNAGKAILASGEGSEVVVSNGWFEAAGTIVAQDSAKIRLVSGYYLDGTSIAGGNVTGVGGKFSSSVTNYTEYARNLPAAGYKYALFAIPLQTNGQTIVAEIVTNVAYIIETKVWPLSNDPSNAVQLPDSFMTTVYPSWSSPAERTNAVNELNKPSAYPGATKWQCYVLGMPDAAAQGAAATTHGPRAEAVGAQDTSTTGIGFRMYTPSAVKAVESGCRVQYEVEAFANSSCSGTPETTSGRVNYDENVEIANPTGVRYYRLKVYITTKK